MDKCVCGCRRKPQTYAVVSDSRDGQSYLMAFAHDSPADSWAYRTVADCPTRAAAEAALRLLSA